MALRALDCCVGRNPGQGKAARMRRRFFTVGVGVSTQTLRHQKAVCGDTQRSMMMKSSPATTFVSNGMDAPTR